jgi:copper chaperone CopZ
MTCDHCKMRIAKAMEAAGLKDYVISVEEKTVSVEAPDGETPKKIMADAGYEATLRS